MTDRPLRQADDGARVAALEAWLDRAARDLPWRRWPRGGPGGDGYAALVAEAMLQQTQVDRVVPRYEAFMRRFPTVDALAAADEEAVLALWQGLGYYRRARSLHAAARQVTEELEGEVPSDTDRLRRLPGVGRYTAGSIASIAFGEREAIVDGNVARVVMRWSARRGTAETSMPWSWRRAAALVEAAARPGTLNEALMELGATVCTPRGPRCDACPVAAWCRAKDRARTDSIPAPKARSARRVIHHHAVVMRRAGAVLLERRPARGLWAGMWQAPTVESEEPMDRCDVAECLQDRLGAKVGRLELRSSFEFLTTHRCVRFQVFVGATRSRQGTWKRLDELGEVPMASAQRKAIEMGMESGTTTA